MRLRAPRIVVATILLVAGVVAGVTIGVSRGGGDTDRRPGGPLVLPRRGAASVGVPVPSGHAFSYGLLAVRNKGRTPVVLEKAWLVSSTRGLKMLGAYALPVPNYRSIGFVAGYTPAWGRALAGLRIAPGAEVQVVIGLSVPGEGRYSFRSVALAYTAGGRRYVGRYAMSGRLCSPVREYVHRCPGLLGE